MTPASVKPQTILKINAKCSDLCAYILIKNGKILIEGHGYAPSILPEDGGDYITLDIDIATGQILNWKAPSNKELDEFIAGEEDSDEEDIDI